MYRYGIFRFLTHYKQNVSIIRKDHVCFQIPKTNFRVSMVMAVRGNTTFTPRRAIMYVPGHDIRKIQKIPTLDVDCVVLDIEDGVAVNKKDEARRSISEISEDFNFGRSEFSVRINSVDSGIWETDLSAVFSGKKMPSTIMVPKVDTVTHVQMIVSAIEKQARKRNYTEKLGLILFVESAKGLLDLRDICAETVKLSNGGACVSLEGLVFGSDDFCADIGASRTSEAVEVLTARQMIIIIAKSFGLQAIDMVHIDYKDLKGLEYHSQQGANMGFTGKQVIHPSQVPIVQQAFAPSAEKIQWATELIKLFEEHQTHGKGAFTFRGAMIDKPLLLQAKNIIKVSEILKQN